MVKIVSMWFGLIAACVSDLLWDTPGYKETGNEAGKYEGVETKKSVL